MSAVLVSAVKACAWALEVLEVIIGVRVGSLRWWAMFGLGSGFGARDDAILYEFGRGGASMAGCKGKSRWSAKVGDGSL